MPGTCSARRCRDFSAAGIATAILFAPPLVLAPDVVPLGTLAAVTVLVLLIVLHRFLVPPRPWENPFKQINRRKTAAIAVLTRFSDAYVRRDRNALLSLFCGRRHGTIDVRPAFTGRERAGTFGGARAIPRRRGVQEISPAQPGRGRHEVSPPACWWTTASTLSRSGPPGAPAIAPGATSPSPGGSSL